MVEKCECAEDTNQYENRKGDGEPSNLRGVLVAGALAFILLLLAAIWWPNLTERMKFFTGNLWNLVIAFAVIAQAVIYRKQWNVMKEQIRRTAISDGAQLGIDGISKPTLSEGETTVVNVLIFNGGRTAARNVTARPKALLGFGYLTKAESEWETPQPKILSVITLPSGGRKPFRLVTDFDMTKEKLEGIESGKWKLLLFVEIHYIDYLNNPQVFPFRLAYNKDYKEWDDYREDQSQHYKPN